MADKRLAQAPVRGVHISAPLSDLSIGYHPVGFIAERVHKVVPVNHENDLYYIWDRGDALREMDTLRADGTSAHLADFGFAPAAYVCEEYALKTRLTDRQKGNADKVLNLQLSKIRRVQDLILAGQERRAANLFSAAALPAANQTTLAGINQFNNGGFVGSIEQVIDTADEAIRQQLGGLPPNQLIIPKAVAKVVKRDSKIRDLVKYTHADLLADGDLPPKLWGKDVLVPSVATVNANPTSSTGSPWPIENPATVLAPGTNIFDIWGKNITVLYSNDNPGIDVISASYIFRSRPWMVKTWRDEEIDSEFYQPSFVQTEKLVSGFAVYQVFAAIA